MDRKLEKIARTGYAAKGFIYGLTGVLTFMAALNLGGEKAGRMQVLGFLQEQVFGNILLAVLGIGIASYAIWRFTQAFSDPENIGKDTRGKFKRVAFFLSGCSYLILGYLAFMRVFGQGNSGEGGEKTSLLMSDFGLIVLGVAGVGIFLRGLYQFYKAFRSDFTRKLNLRFSSNKRRLGETAGKIGFSARGVLFVIIGYFAFRAAITANPSEMKDTQEAFSFIEASNFGPMLLALVALGAIGYAVFMFLVAKYRQFSA